MSGTAFDAEGNARILGIALYPTERDQQVESKALHELAKDLDVYIHHFVDLLKANGDKTRLKVA